MPDNPIIARIGEHYAGLGRGHVDVPEWGDGTTALRIWFTPVTVYDKRRIFRGGGASEQELSVDALIQKALKEDGSKLFTLDDRQALLHKADANVVERVATALLSAVTADEAEKN